MLAIHLVFIFSACETAQAVHYSDVIMGAMANQITSLTIVYSTVCSGADQRKHKSSMSLAFVWGSHRTGEVPAHKSSNAENVSSWWRHYDTKLKTRKVVSPPLLTQRCQTILRCYVLPFAARDWRPGVCYWWTRFVWCAQRKIRLRTKIL